MKLITGQNISRQIFSDDYWFPIDEREEKRKIREKKLKRIFSFE